MLSSPLHKRVLRVYPFFLFNQHLVDYPTPVNFNYFWGLGSLAGLALFGQMLTGVFLAMYYVPSIAAAFDSVEHIMRDVSSGWVIRYSHAIGASVFFAVVYGHMARGLYYGSYSRPRGHVWTVGVFIFILMMATAFMGYVLPWGQMSFRGATVITNLFTALPYVGENIAHWLWGGFSVGGATLNRFFSLHYLLPFLIVGLVIVHLMYLHFPGSGNPLGFRSVFFLPFYPYFFVKDFVGVLGCSSVFFTFLFFYPNGLGHPDNYIEANILVTPEHIVPEWYFSPFYAILRSIPSKLGGVTFMAAAIFVLWCFPFFTGSDIRSTRFTAARQHFLLAFFFNFVFLGWLGACPVEAPFVLFARFSTIIYFFVLSFMLPSFGAVSGVVVRHSFRIVFL